MKPLRELAALQREWSTAVATCRRLRRRCPAPNSAELAAAYQRRDACFSRITKLVVEEVTRSHSRTAVPATVACAHCGHGFASVAVVYPIVVGRRARSEPLARIRCRHCESLNVLELVDQVVVAELAKEG